MVETLPSDQSAALLAQYVAVLLPKHPETLRDKLTRHLKNEADNWLWRNQIPTARVWDKLDARIRSAMRYAMVDTIEDLAKLSDNELLAIDNFGNGCLKRVREMAGQPYRDRYMERYIERITRANNAPNSQGQKQT